MSSDTPTHTLFLVPSVSHVLKGEQALLRAGIPCRLIPLPRDLGSQCGVCLRVDHADRHSAEKVLQAAGAQVDGTHDVRMPAAEESGGARPTGTETQAGKKGEGR